MTWLKLTRAVASHFTFIVLIATALSLAPAKAQTHKPSASGDKMLDFVSVVLAETENAWHAIFKRHEQTYLPPKLVLYTARINTSCGLGEAQSGPFYCTRDNKIYLDTSFFDDLTKAYKAPGDFAQAYVIAHEVAHHVQFLLGIEADMQRQAQDLNETGRNKLSVQQELQADCFAGIWGRSAIRLLEPGDLEEAITATKSLGDDRLQRLGRGFVVPDSFTHGTSAQRKSWFLKGFETGKLKACDTSKL